MLNVFALWALLTIAEGAYLNETGSPPPASRGLPDPSVEYNMCPIPNQDYPFNADMVPAYCVCMHCKGPKGDQGPKGDRGNFGAPGRPGSSGMKGIKGARDPRGPGGFRGLKGQKGTRGPRGMMGLKGIRGHRGFEGRRGLRGNPGANGLPGAKGSSGVPGQCPAECQSIKGDPGQKGDTGSSGPKGDMGEVGLSGQPGLKGETGSTGFKGDTGVEGVKGSKGELGSCDCVDGVKGEPGSTGPTGPGGIKGDQGPAGEEGKTGEKGARGEQGNEGEEGPPGPCAPTIQSAFSAGRNVEDGLPNPFFPIPFTVIFYNRQGHFNPTVGVYIAPVNGTYEFSYHLSIQTNPIKLGLFKNRKLVIKTSSKATQGQASQTVILHLTARDKIWLQVKDSSFNGVSADQDTDSTFSGFLLYPDSCLPVISRALGPATDQTDYYNPYFDYEPPTSPADDGSGSGTGSGSNYVPDSGSSFEPSPPNANEAPS
ncbi:LOW QUALITY PROTEIN: complement C1q and tumor necrosis factor-related protein 9-like [Leucoraja erinacea]|uniref:LOW QUALITY PROTEIN: complement C1q and tumor necrosis factor-related protein 9-like n=1 Tax=Leucoraja erinaceus TaxID=7782 RepID=UPI002454C2F3|nr:LOW QUALITY PROTEIN: complement C1q and tumor necrosis factor-related protein 9-like [Leucoraja erinacea]